jgi:hypothetical protein
MVVGPLPSSLIDSLCSGGLSLILGFNFGTLQKRRKGASQSIITFGVPKEASGDTEGHTD